MSEVVAKPYLTAFGYLLGTLLCGLSLLFFAGVLAYGAMKLLAIMP